MVLLDGGQPRAALNAFQRLLRLRREDPDDQTNSAADLESVLPWLVRAHAAVARQSAHGGFSESKGLPGNPDADIAGLESDAYDHYRVLQ